MKKIKVGDIVCRISYDKDIMFEVQRIIKLNNNNEIAILKGIIERIEADSDINDLYLLQKEKVKNNIRAFDDKVELRIEKRKINKKNTEKRATSFINRTGKILHLDGDRKYSEKSFRYYRKLGLTAIVKNIPENKQPKVVYNLLKYYKPDILVITRT